MEPSTTTRDIYISETRLLNSDITENGKTTECIRPGSKAICSANIKIKTNYIKDPIQKFKAKLDSCGSVSLAHTNLLKDIRPVSQHHLPKVRLLGIGGKTNFLTKAGVLNIQKPNKRTCRILCYVFDEVLGNTKEMLLISLSAIVESKINILHHMAESNKNQCTDIQFWPDDKSLDDICSMLSTMKTTKDIESTDIHPRDLYLSTEMYNEEFRQDVVEVTKMAHNINNTVIHGTYMTEIQLRRIVDRTKNEELSDGDETMMKDGVKISKFSKEAMHLGDDVYTNETILQKIYVIYDRYVGGDKVFPLKNGAPKILTKYKDTPYSYELQPEYAAGNKKFPCVKAMNWTGKIATAHVVRGFVQSTPVVEPCALPLCISQLVIAPKFAPGQVKDDPDHGFRVCVNALINKCLKPYASTVPLATDEIKKLHGYKYYLQVDGFSAYWSIPVCEESKRLTAFHTPDGIYCWNRLMMGATPSSAVQQTAYLEALDQYIDFKENGEIRDCLLDENGNRLKDKDGNTKTLRHRFAVYCDDIAAGADTLEELYELFEALICCCFKAGIQIKSGKVKFGVPKVTFHNYTISRHGTEPKDANLCPIKNMKAPKNITQVRAFLGCCQQLNHYIKDYGIIAKPLHTITGKGVQGPPPWIIGSDYDIAFQKLKAIITNNKLYLHHKDSTQRLFLEVDASDVGWGGCAYQMKERWKGDPKDEGRMRINDKGTRLIIQWISKAWTAHELGLPVFYRESLARILLLAKFRNLIETNIDAGITLYTDHKPALFENSLSNKGQLSAWKLAEVADLLSIVENLYRQGGKMLFADPLSRVCSPTSGWFISSRPAKLATLLKFLPISVKQNKHVRIYADKDTHAVGRVVQAWREPKNRISHGKLLTTDISPSTFYLGMEDVTKTIKDIKQLIIENKSFAILMPVSTLDEISREENTESRNYNADLLQKVDNLSKIVLTPTSEVWVINVPDFHITKIVSHHTIGYDEETARQTMINSTNEFIATEMENMEIFPTTRSQAIESDESDDDSIYTPAGNAIVTRNPRNNSGKPTNIKISKDKDSIKWTRAPREPIPPLQNISSWVGKQLDHTDLPKRYRNLPPQGELITDLKDFPDGLLAVPNSNGTPRIIVPPDQVKPLVLQTHEDIHHQNQSKVEKILVPLYYWPNMVKTIESWCTSCPTCARGTVRRKHLKMKYDPNAPAATSLPRADYGMDFYGLQKGEVLVIVDLFTREVIFIYLPNRSQDNVAKALLNRVIFTRGVPCVIRNDNAPELSSLTGAVSAICEYLQIDQIRTGGHNPRGNAICERANQTLGAMIRKLSDYEYKNIKEIALPAFQFAINTTFNSAIGCTPFEAGHGLNATTIAQARLHANRITTDTRGGNDGDIAEDIDEFFDTDIIKDQFELAMRMAEVARSTSEWHRRMTADKLSQDGRIIDMDKLQIGTKAYIYKPPTANETKTRGRKAKHLDHYIGPGTIIKHIGKRSVVVQVKDKDGTPREYQRDAGMVILHKVRPCEMDPSIRITNHLGTRVHTTDMLQKEPLQEGEFIILKDGPEAKDWYCAEIKSILIDQIEVNYYTTATPPLDKYHGATIKKRKERLRHATFLRTWCLDRGKGAATTTSPKTPYGRLNYLWRGRIPIESLDDHILIRDVGLSALGKLDQKSIEMAAKLGIPHHQGAGTDDDPVESSTFERGISKRRRTQRK